MPRSKPYKAVLILGTDADFYPSPKDFNDIVHEDFLIIGDSIHLVTPEEIKVTLDFLRN